ncbi:hypothetical protein B0H14DRAFT_2640899 [Mycena olivaceomarginata]|nr:hypothetical protein B0H14DRAFT_2640899 [Mycena olivaceomarginata]
MRHFAIGYYICSNLRSTADFWVKMLYVILRTDGRQCWRQFHFAPSNPLRIHAEQAAPKFDPTQGQDLRTIFGNTSGSQANVAATVAFAPPTEHFPALPAAQMAASSDTSRSDSAPIDFNALGDLSDADFFAF